MAQAKTCVIYKIIRIVRALSLVCKHFCDITRILIGNVLSEARWLVGNMSMYQENQFQSKSKNTTTTRIFPHLSNYFEKYFIKAIEEVFSVFT